MSHIQKQLTNNRGTGLHLVLTHHWYGEIDSGRKTVEFREHTDFWHKRIVEKWFNRLGGRNLVTFHRGYTDTTMTFEVPMICMRYGVIELHLGTRLLEEK